MSYVKLGLFFALFYVINRWFYWLILPLTSWFANLVTLAIVSWQVMRVVHKRLVVPRLTKVDPRLKGVFITGCDTGFGHQVALKMNQLGFYVFAACYDPESAGAKELKKNVMKKTRLQVIPLDVTKPDQVADALVMVETTLKDPSSGVTELYAVLNNAGIMHTGFIEAGPSDSISDWDQQFAINTFGMVRVARKFLPLLRKSKGRIVNVASIVARIGINGVASYSASKAAAAKFTEILQGEMALFGVTVIGIEPWIARTNLIIGEMFFKSFKDSYATSTPEVKEAYNSKIYEETLKLSQSFVDNKYNCEIKQVVGDMIDALTSPDPLAVYSPITWPWKIFFFITNDHLPWDVLVPLRSVLDRLFKMAP